MILSIVKRNLSLFQNKNATFFYLVRFTSSSNVPSNRNPSPNFSPISEFLINSCGLSPKRAAAALQEMSKFASVVEADSVRHFFKHRGFGDASIRRLISNYPRILNFDVNKTLEPNCQTLHEMGFTASELEQLIVSNPYVLVSRLAIPRLEFWQNFIGTNNRKELVSLFTKNRGLIGLDIQSGIALKISLLKEHGLSDRDIIFLMKRGGFVLGRKPDAINALLEKIKDMGFGLKSRSSLLQGFASLSSMGGNTFAGKMEFFKGFGWSEEEFYAAFRRAPCFITLKKENIREKMDFLVGSLGCDRSDIVSKPLLLYFSLRKRLKPRHYVMKMLQSKGICVRMRVYSILCLSEKRFIESIILRHKDQLPEIHETYLAACAGQIPI